MSSKNLSLIIPTEFETHELAINNHIENQLEQLNRFQEIEREKGQTLNTLLGAFSVFLEDKRGNAPEHKAWMRTLRDGKDLLEWLGGDDDNDS